MVMGVRVIKLALLVFLFGFIFMGSDMAVAHSGRTDAYGGHNCYVGACAGTYHYHNGGYVEEDYYDQGYEFGSNDAFDNNHDYITSNAESEGQKKGYDDGLNGEDEEFYPDAPSWICDDVSFDFRANEYADYIDGVNDGFGEACIELANSVYSDTYSESYAEGYAEFEEKQKSAESSSSSSLSGTDDSSGSGSGWGWLLGIGGFYGALALIGNWDSIRDWARKL